jgi:hypothetical protein
VTKEGRELSTSVHVRIEPAVVAIDLGDEATLVFEMVGHLLSTWRSLSHTCSLP